MLKNENSITSNLTLDYRILFERNAEDRWNSRKLIKNGVFSCNYARVEGERNNLTALFAACYYIATLYVFEIEQSGEDESRCNIIAKIGLFR